MIYILPKETREKIIQNIKDEAKPDKYFYIMVVLSCIIATYGLLSNSVAVIIGAMLIAPLMYPILKGAISATIGNQQLFKKAIFAELSGVLVAITCAILLTLILPSTIATPEILARTKPTLLDLAVAIASGLAGTVAICYRPSSAILPGVAIASALMPPLCVVGISIANHNYNNAGGAFILFLSNVIAINVSAIIIFHMVGFGERLFQIDKTNSRTVFLIKRILSPFIVLILISLPLFFFMKQSFDNTDVENKITSVINGGLGSIDTSNKIESMNFSYKNKKIYIKARIRSVKPLEPEDIRKFENKLEYELGQPVKITAEVLPMTRVTGTESSQDELKKTTPDKTIQEKKEYTEQTEDLIEHSVNEKLTLVPDSELVNFSFKYSSITNTYNIYLEIRSPEKLDNNIQKSIKLNMESILKRKVVFHIKQDFVKGIPHKDSY